MGPRSDQVILREKEQFMAASLNFMHSNKDVMFREKEDVTQIGVYILPLVEACLCLMQLYDPVGE